MGGQIVFQETKFPDTSRAEYNAVQRLLLNTGELWRPESVQTSWCKLFVLISSLLNEAVS